MRDLKVIQFGEGGFLRGFVDWMLQIVNENTDFNGSVTVVQPIKNGLCDMLTEQNCVYTHLCRGIEGVDKRKIKKKKDRRFATSVPNITVFYILTDNDVDFT